MSSGIPSNRRQTLYSYKSVLLRWDTLTDEEKDTTYPPIAPSFIVELRFHPECSQKNVKMDRSGGRGK
ncbi:6111_t:CDS:2 [Diversispora eburnea]|uniref:6111_t:CDS:1 n=1 Tax=Diversispora eburnea TaxID=1213867 RepID=A0A9N9FAX0_9GLOM|nr:6111_t:CDS:2 [Diversispora eburnea]